MTKTGCQTGPPMEITYLFGFSLGSPHLTRVRYQFLHQTSRRQNQTLYRQRQTLRNQRQMRHSRPPSRSLYSILRDVWKFFVENTPTPTFPATNNCSLSRQCRQVFAKHLPNTYQTPTCTPTAKYPLPTLLPSNTSTLLKHAKPELLPVNLKQS